MGLVWANTATCPAAKRSPRSFSAARAVHLLTASAKIGSCEPEPAGVKNFEGLSHKPLIAHAIPERDNYRVV
jgi:hypothetical protein